METKELMGILFAFFHHTELFSPHMKAFLTTGILGALTTYSTFAWESFYMLSNGIYGHFTLNISIVWKATIEAFNGVRVCQRLGTLAKTVPGGVNDFATCFFNDFVNDE